MKIQVKNLGILDQAEFELGDLTIICGGNNTGKTYATYALFGFLSTWRSLFVIKIDDNKIEQLLADGVINFEIQEYVRQANQIITQACNDYVKFLPQVFAASSDRFKEASFQTIVDTETINLKPVFERTTHVVRPAIRDDDSELFLIKKKADSTELVVTLLVEKENIKISTDALKFFIANALKEIIFEPLFPRPFIASAERTGAAIFLRKELNFDTNPHSFEKPGDKIALLFALPIKSNIDFTRNLEIFNKKRSFIAENHPQILNDFSDIIGGNYNITSNGELYYTPKGNKQIKLSIDEWSSAVRSLLLIGFYLKHEAKPGDLLMIDEPELNLHPENQRRVARLLARLVNIGIKVFVTTHSDYIIKELNTLIMLNHDKPHLKRIAEDEGYQPSELLSANQIKVYNAELASIKLEGHPRKKKYQTLTPADINPELGIEVRSFDTAIETMNRIQEAIVWGE